VTHQHSQCNYCCHYSVTPLIELKQKLNTPPALANI